MTSTGRLQDEQNIARCRLALSLGALAAVYADPTQPFLSRWIPMVTGPFVMDPSVLAVMGAHLAYSVSVYVGLAHARLSPDAVATKTMWGDVLFGAAIGALTEGVTSPFFLFFAFAVVVVGLRAGLRTAMLVTSASVGLYVCLILISTGRGAGMYIMRPVYLAITGYLVGSLGQQRLELEEKVRQLDAAAQRHQIGRDLHDNFIQALAGINLRLGACCRLLRTHAVAAALTDLADLQTAINREHDELRAYMRSLAGLEVTPSSPTEPTATRLRIEADLSGSVDLVDHVLQIVREGIANIRRHARAQAASIRIDAAPAQVHISIDDNGVGFPGDASPWSIASRVKEMGGELRIRHDDGQGAHLSIILPQ